MKSVTTGFCASCGRKRRLSFPKGEDPYVCTQRCAAKYALGKMAGGSLIYCRDCGAIHPGMESCGGCSEE